MVQVRPPGSVAGPRRGLHRREPPSAGLGPGPTPPTPRIATAGGGATYGVKIGWGRPSPAFTPFTPFTAGLGPHPPDLDPGAVLAPRKPCHLDAEPSEDRGVSAQLRAERDGRAWPVRCKRFI